MTPSDRAQATLANGSHEKSSQLTQGHRALGDLTQRGLVTASQAFSQHIPGGGDNAVIHEL